MEHGIIYPDTQSAAFPGICETKAGTWISTFRTAPEKNTVTGQRLNVCRSCNRGQTWSEPEVPFSGTSVNGKPGLFRGGYCTPLPDGTILMVLCWVDHSDPSLPFYNTETEGLLDTRIFLSRSADDGITWEKPVLIDTSPFTVPTPITGPVLIGENEWVLQFELNKHYRDTEKWIHSSVLMFSRDQGESWPEYRVLSRDPDIFYWDQRPAFTGSRKMLNLFWTFDRKQAEYRNIHGSISEDSGRSWSEFFDTAIPGQPAQPGCLENGMYCMVYIDRRGEPEIRITFSKDRGKTWEPGETLYRHTKPGTEEYRKQNMNDAWDEMGKFSAGLPCTHRLRNGDLLISFYAGPVTDRTAIHWILISREELSVLAGER
ncbi:MAG: sialidase family protein [Spirochaetia bacterium]